MPTCLSPRSGDESEDLAVKEAMIERQIRIDKAEQARDKIHLLRRERARKAGKPVPTLAALRRPRTPPPILEAHPFSASPKSGLGRLPAGITMQVPMSPSPQRVRPPVSPARHVLGIDKGLTGRQVSLRPSPQKPAKTFNQRAMERLKESQAVSSKAAARDAARATSFSKLLPAFFSATKRESYIEPVGGYQIHDPVVDKSVVDTLKDRTCFTVHQFFAAAGPPDYTMNDDVIDYVLAGIISGKTDARTTQSEHASKYMVMTITDLKVDISIFLYEGAFDKFWTLPIGTVIYILNPAIQKPRNGASADKLTLKVTDPDKILEVAKATDFGLCRTIKQSGQQCTQWINTRKQAEGVCNYHLELKFEKNQKKRTEFSSGTRAYDPRQPTQKKRKENEKRAQHGVFFGDAVTTGPGGHAGDGQYEAPVKDMARLQREMDNRQRDRQAVARLMQRLPASAGNDYFVVAKDATADETDEKPAVFSATTIRKMGFDPTRRAQAPVAQHDRPIADLAAELTRDVENVDLHVQRNAGSSKFTVAGIEADKKLAEQKLAAKQAVKKVVPVAQTSSSTLPMADSDSDSDSDLEIVR